MSQRRPRRARLAAPERVHAILDRAGENRFAREREAIPAAVWRDAVGLRIAERAYPMSLWDGVLLLRVPSSVWANELSMLATDVCARLQARGVAAKELRFRVGALPAVERPAERRVTRSVPVERQVPYELIGVLATVSDADLRAAIEHAAAANLAWQSMAREAPVEAISEALRAARAPRSSGGESAPQDRGTTPSREESRGKRGGGPDRSR